MQIFISQPMRNRNDEEIREERRKIMEYVSKLYPDEECTEIQSFFNIDIESKNVPLRMLGMSLELMADADVAIFAQNWEIARGCQIEHQAAEAYGMKIIDLGD